MQTSIPSIQNIDIAYFSGLRKRSYFLYWAAMLMVIVTIISLPFIRLPIEVDCQGLVRPVGEPAEIRSFSGGMIDSLYYKEGSQVKKGDVLFRIKSNGGDGVKNIAHYKEKLTRLKNDNAASTDGTEITSPITGSISGLSGKYTNTAIPSGGLLCSISPDGALIGECYLATRDIGMINQNQVVHFQVDAFNYNFFGLLSGKVISIDHDVILNNGTPFFKVLCQFDSTQLHLKNGYTGHLMKGLTFRAMFVIGEQSIWNLLWNKMDNWLTPNS